MAIFNLPSRNGGDGRCLHEVITFGSAKSRLPSKPAPPQPTELILKEFNLEDPFLFYGAIRRRGGRTDRSDLPLEKARALLGAARAHDMALILLVTPESGHWRIEEIAQESSGFLYLVASYGRTGAKEELAEETRPLIGRVRSLISNGLPLAVGFRLARPEHIRDVIQAGANGAVVGSRIVAKMAKVLPPEALAAFVRSLKEGTVGR